MSLRLPGNFAKLFVLAVLVSSLACSELPELTRLIDNSSNDFTAPSYVTEEVSNTVATQVSGTPSARRMAFSRPQPNNLLQIRQFRNSRDLLLLCSILRT